MAVEVELAEVDKKKLTEVESGRSRVCPRCARPRWSLEQAILSGLPRFAVWQELFQAGQDKRRHTHPFRPGYQNWCSPRERQLQQ